MGFGADGTCFCRRRQAQDHQTERPDVELDQLEIQAPQPAAKPKLKRKEYTSLSPGAREIYTEALIFRYRAEIGRVIFISAPLRGSDLASNWIGRIGSSLVRAPSTLLGMGDAVLDIATFNFGDLKLKHIPNSVDTLAPNNHFVKAINTIPITPSIPY